MRRMLGLLVSCVMLLSACSPAPSAESQAAFTRAVSKLESSIAQLDEPAADAAFSTVVTMLRAQPDLITDDGRSGPEVLLEAARLGRENSTVPLNSCEICTEEAPCGWTEADALAMLAYLYPEDERVWQAIDAFVPALPEDVPSSRTDDERAVEFQERIKPHVDRVLARLESAEASSAR
ncbi:MAG: hypothetical protein ACYCX5_13360 [Coriobacteriia bacterium]